MKQKMSLNINFFEGYHLLSVTSTLKDYTLAFFINRQLNLRLRKYGDLRLSANGGTYSWYYFKVGNKYLSCYLIGNNHPKQKLLPALQHFDYFFLLKDTTNREQVRSMAAAIRKIKNVIGVFEQDISGIKGMDVLIECNEFHEMEQVIAPLKKLKNKKQVFTFNEYEAW
ncbi:MAG: IPExxxVDY family protein [Bacteroidales bacterium]|nr:IPExxxVDY family protein [Bacteroidales bacterium]MCF6341820.1 IPExxxVDY family protein [Bacteroidales bacterium]